jgi:flavocytochrome c
VKQPNRREDRKEFYFAEALHMKKWNERTDIVVIGSGLAGLSAAIEAAEAGASVLVLEKMKGTGGNTRISDGGVAAPNNYLQRARGVADSPEILEQDMFRAGLGLNNPELVKILAEKANDAVEWTRHRLGVAYQDRLDRFGGHSVARCLTTKNHTGADFIRAQSRVLKQMGVEIRTRCRLTRLHTDGHGAVRGVQVHAGRKGAGAESGEELNVRARRAVILATGGFGSDIVFRALQQPRLDESVGTTNHCGATAEGLIAAMAANAAPVHLSWIQLGPWGCPDESKYGRGARFTAYSVYPAGILVDPATGRRIVDEWSDRRQRCDAMFAAGHPCVGIVDALGARFDEDSLRHCLKKGVVKGFDALRDLAAEYDMPGGRLERTVKDYNRTVRKRGEDPFGKPLRRGAPPLARAPFYAIRLWPKVHYTSGGVGIDACARVIDVHRRPIAGLFAAGEVCGGIHGASRLGNCALTECIVFGRIAGKEAARQAA